MQDIVVYIALDTKPTPRETLLPLLLTTEGAHEYKEYTDLVAVKADHGVTTQAYKAAAALFGQTEHAPAPIKCCAIFGVAPETTDANLVKAIKDLRDVNDEWYFLLPVEPVNSARLKALSDWVKTTVLSPAQLLAGEVESEKLLIVQTADKTLRSVNAQTVLCYNHKADESFMPAAWVGRVAPNYPSAVTWKWKELDGIEVTDLKGPALHTLLEGNVNTYISNNKRDYMSEGICCDTDYIDTVIGRWQIKQDIRRTMTDLFVDNEVVPYDNAGFSQVGATVIAALNRATSNGIVLADEGGKGAFSVGIPRRADATREEAANRVMPPIAWGATLRGGMHGVRVNGLITVSLVKAE